MELPRPPAQRHTIKFDLPEGLLGQFGSETLHEGIPKARIAGAIASGVGAYLLVRVFQKTAGVVLMEIGSIARLLGGILPGTGFLGFFPDSPVAQADEMQGNGEENGEELLTLEPFAVSIGLITGGMILAGQNPGEILKGIGEIIPG